MGGLSCPGHAPVLSGKHFNSSPRDPPAAWDSKSPERGSQAAALWAMVSPVLLGRPSSAPMSHTPGSHMQPSQPTSCRLWLNALKLHPILTPSWFIHIPSTEDAWVPGPTDIPQLRGPRTGLDPAAHSVLM